MTAVSLFNKTKTTPAQQLSEWLRRGQSEVFTVTTMVTPDLARLLLATNDDNRNVVFEGSRRSVAAYAAAMKRGEWALNGVPIIVSRDGQLNDGQHRLHAVIRSQDAITMQIVFGVERETRNTVDQGMARTPGHILAMRGEANCNQLAMALQFLWAHDENASLNHRPSPDQLIATLDRHPEARDAVKAVRSLFGHYRLSAGYLAGAHYLCRKADAFAADQFLDAVTTGLNIQNVNSPVARLRRAYEDHRAGLKGMRLTATMQAAFYIKAFNNLKRGRTGPIIWRSVGPAPEAFPKAGA